MAQYEITLTQEVVLVKTILTEADTELLALRQVMALYEDKLIDYEQADEVVNQSTSYSFTKLK